MEAVVRLPCTSDLSQSLLNFLAEEFKTPEDLSRSSVVESELQKRCSDIESSLSNLRSRLLDRISVYAAHSSNVSTVVGGVRAALVALQTRDGEEDKGSGRTEQILGEELPALARRWREWRLYGLMQVGLKEFLFGLNYMERVLIRLQVHLFYDAMYFIKRFETALKLDSLVGDVEDAVSSSVRVKLISPSQAAVSEIEDIVESIRKQGLIGQQLQIRRKGRLLKGHKPELDLHQPLWVIEELVNPIFLASQQHFSKWVDKPEFIFALVFKINRDLVDSLDDILQPWVDKARLGIQL
ncbi:hypothetical protein HPP92_016457 [Vanilla planifolia]|uniref:Uncharacterized protein n=1 Tax=Vanilla planifolia TaxID=51239 RepID=A0A835QIV7_VANPL|nr:hypothetical protein HPP92_016457 [Vanilla planifolia]